ncbi:hypothetical protein BD779DRAFT_895438 [Infundibulicybe gibba]|nr:hypothetical protein BD779DRAFT_895438 [Infundibulicybe gibba]
MFLRNNSYFDISTPNSGILSPLSFMSPNSSRTASIENFATIEPKKMVNGNQGPGRLPEPSTPAYPSTNTNDNGKGKERAVDRESLEVQALNFEQKGTNVKHCFHFWHHRAADAAAWAKACKQSEAYREKAQKQRTSLNGHSEKKRRVSSGLKLTTESPQKRRARRRVSTEYQMPRSDEELARRFKENHQEHQHRWAQGSFLEVTRTHISTNATAPPLSWHIWLSLNPESDATAIWLERKFDIPASGNWTTNLIFSIPLSTSGKKTSSEFPGLLVFECTPLENVADELERKYRILDDCARLRDVIKSLPARRHFVPSLLVLRWEGESQTHPAPDFFDMIQKHVDDSVLGGFSIFSIASEAQDLDSKLVQALKPLPLDTEGRLVRRLNLRGLFKCFEPHLTSFISEWLENCSANGDFDCRGDVTATLHKSIPPIPRAESQ